MKKTALAKRIVPPTAIAAVPLDRPINDALDALNRAIGLWQAIEPRVSAYLSSFDPEDPLLKGESEADRAGKLVSLLEKLSRTAVNLVKVTDEAARLRDLLTGGADEREDIKDLDDRQLQDILVETVLARGLWRLVRERAAERGVVIDVEPIEVKHDLLPAPKPKD